MMSDPAHEVTGVLASLPSDGGDAVLDRLVPLVYDELRTIARAQLRRERDGISLQATALVHEAYLRLSRQQQLPWRNRGDFFHAAAEAMRRILIERARREQRVKRGGRPKRVSLSGIDLATPENADELLALDDAIRRLEEQDERAARVVRLRFYAGLSVEETAEALSTSERTVKREWAFARAWLFRALGHGD